MTQTSHYGKQAEVYNGFDLTLNARFGQGGQVSGGMSMGRTVIDNCVIVDSPEAARPGFCKVAPPWSSGTQVKFLFVYPLPWELQASAIYQNIPGLQITASYVATNAEILPSLGRNLAACGTRVQCNSTATVDLIPQATLFEPRLQQLDVRLARLFRARGLRLRGNIDVYNLFNASPILNQTTRYGPAWLQPTQILGGRLFKLTAQVDF